MSSQNDNQPRNYTLIYPVYNLKISRDIGGEIQIERVIFVSREKIPWIRKRIGLYLLKILNGKLDVRIDSKWKNSIRNAAIFAGKSHFSKELSTAFLYNFIAIDNLLSNPGEKYPDCLIDRLNALFGWLTDEKLEAWKPAIKRLYDLRNEMVHYGDTRRIRTEDLILSDNILYNILYNICRFINHFPKKQSLIDLSIRVNARRILGQKVRERQNFQYSRISMPSSTISKIKKENNWP